MIGIGIAALIIILQYYAAQYIKHCKYMEGVNSDKRLKVITDIINGIRTIKAYAWELPFLKLVNTYRKKMVKHTFASEVTESFMWGISGSGGYFMAIGMFGYHYAMNREFNYEDSLAIIGVASYTSFVVFNQLFVGISIYSTFRAVLRRVGEIIDMEEFTPILNDEKDKISDGKRIHFEKANLTWGFSTKKDQNAKDEVNNEAQDVNLKDITLSMRDSDFVAIAGAVGCGKSTFLAAVMNELTLLNGTVNYVTLIHLMFEL